MSHPTSAIMVEPEGAEGDADSRGGNYWRPANDRSGCDTGVLDLHGNGINIAFA